MASTDPRTATQGQWEDLADKVNSKAEIGTILSTPTNAAYVDTDNIVDGAVTADKIATGALYEIIGTTTGNINYAIKYADGRLTCYQRYTATSKATSSWGNVYSADSLYTPQNYAVPFINAPIVSATISGIGSAGLNVWLSADGGSAPGSTTKPHKYQLTRGTSGSNVGGTTIDIVAEGFWK